MVKPINKNLNGFFYRTMNFNASLMLTYQLTAILEIGITV